MYAFGMEIDTLALLTMFVIVLVIYLVILELEFRHIRTITRKFDEEEIQLGRAMRELKDEVTALKDVMSAKKVK